MKKSNREEFILKAQRRHDNKYNYSNVVYVNSSTKVEIICPIHGSFFQSPSGHLMGKGCPACGGKQKKTNDDFIDGARSKHGDKFDYSGVNYINARTKVLIGCRIHGPFWQSPRRHIRGDGCPICAGRYQDTESFIRKARSLHGNIYDYSKVDYINCSTKVLIVCSLHGDFFQTPNSHLCGAGCPVCGGTKKKTKEEFVNASRAVHGNKYDYSKVIYENNRKKVCIICPEHGEFWQTPDSHMQGRGCQMCGRIGISVHKKKQKDLFLEEAFRVHGTRYDYSLVDYIGNDKTVMIKCDKHGVFKQTPKSHLRGQGCPKCVGLNRSTEEYIEMARQIHGDRFDYSKVEYNGSNRKVIIICPKHGEFLQTPHSHLRGAGCPMCAGLNKTTQDFIREAIAIHGDKYDYSKAEYKGAFERICIICPEHGEFWQEAKSHANGSGCPKCNDRQLEKEVRNALLSLAV